MPKSNNNSSMDHAIIVYVSPANNSSEYLQSISTQSTGSEDPGEKLDEGALVNETSGQLSKAPSDKRISGYKNKSPSALAQVTCTLQMANS